MLEGNEPLIVTVQCVSKAACVMYYLSRSNLPDNLKQLFRSLAMTKPDRQLIAQVMLYSQGFRTAEKLASKIVPFFK